MYNESVQVGFVIWNESLWCLFYVFARVTLARHPDADMQLYLHFLRVECSVTSNLLFLFVPKMLHLFRKAHVLHGTLTDVHGVRQVHRVSVRLGGAGEVQSVYCVPCGPLALADDDSATAAEEPDVTLEEARRYVREDEYSKAEVDALIEMVSRLKTEKETYKTETRRLWQAMHDHGLGGGSLTSSAVSPVEEDIVIGAPLRRPGPPLVPRLGGRSRASVQPAPLSYHVADAAVVTDPLAGISLPSSPERCRRASTVSSYLSSSRSSVADVSSADDLLGGSGLAVESPLDGGMKLPLLDGFGGLRVTDVDRERVDNIACNLGRCFTDNNGNCNHQQALVATVYDALTSPVGAISYADYSVLRPVRYARCGLAASRKHQPRVCSKVNFIMHI
ncbi:hypothetical protein NP493_5094g00004 [Ridgeia piscesae]|nr:hypothetical protein NP493_5094g00004 [Ridgeia piscesae]